MRGDQSEGGRTRRESKKERKKERESPPSLSLSLSALARYSALTHSLTHELHKKEGLFHSLSLSLFSFPLVGGPADWLAYVVTLLTLLHSLTHSLTLTEDGCTLTHSLTHSLTHTPTACMETALKNALFPSPSSELVNGLSLLLATLTRYAASAAASEAVRDDMSKWRRPRDVHYIALVV